MDQGPRYDRASEAAAVIMNLYLYADMPKPEIFSRIVCTILAAMLAADSELYESRHHPSDN
jgi:hypothetical protein